MESKKGQLNQIFMVFILVVLIIIFICGYFLYSLIAAPFAYISNDITTIVQNDVASDGNLSIATNVTIGSVNRTIQGNLEWVSYGIILSAVLAFIFSAFFIRTYPFLIIFWIGFGVVAVFISIFLALTYADIRNGDGYLALAYQAWGANDYLMTYLPHLTITFFLITGIILFLLISKDEQAEVAL